MRKGNKRPVHCHSEGMHEWTVAFFAQKPIHGNSIEWSGVSRV